MIDGELVALASDRQGWPSQGFDRLFRTIFGRGEEPLWLVVFDAPQLVCEQRHDRGMSRSALEARCRRAAPGQHELQSARATREQVYRRTS